MKRKVLILSMLGVFVFGSIFTVKFTLNKSIFQSIQIMVKADEVETIKIMTPKEYEELTGCEAITNSESCRGKDGKL